MGLLGDTPGHPFRTMVRRRGTQAYSRLIRKPRPCICSSICFAFWVCSQHQTQAWVRLASWACSVLYSALPRDIQYKAKLCEFHVRMHFASNVWSANVSKPQSVHGRETVILMTLLRKACACCVSLRKACHIHPSAWLPRACQVLAFDAADVAAVAVRAFRGQQIGLQQRGLEASTKPRVASGTKPCDLR